ncbi:hypothetical protein ACIS_00516 [Anaplasma centrale str. Israel]|uniref:Uncharacterized protein n=1 Tax=Anaplasma centrale (strain Israel) TaxID=574556 RepID=D1AUA5_ANACI|nr:hypothetical protein ACIS_00516 [Anaplasma centrale str. Israel]
MRIILRSLGLLDSIAVGWVGNYGGAGVSYLKRFKNVRALVIKDTPGLCCGVHTKCCQFRVTALAARN